MLLQDKILIVLHGGGPRTNSEIADILTAKVNSIRTANTHNAQMGRVTYNRVTKGESKMCVTPAGIERIQRALTSSYKLPPPSTPVRDALIKQLRKGLWTRDWAKVCRSKSTLYKWIIDLQKEGFVLHKKKEGVTVFYKIVKEPPQK